MKKKRIKKIPYSKRTEHDEQVEFFNYVRIKALTDYRYKAIFAIPNAGKRSIRAAMYYKAEGLMSGVPDVFIAVANHAVHGLFLEFKTIIGKESENQKDWRRRLNSQAYAVKIVRSGNEAIETLEKYFA